MRVPFDKQQRAAIAQLVAACGSDPLVMIGAAALDCSLEMTWRRTADIDFVLVQKTGNPFVDGLLSAGFTQPSPEIEHRWAAPNGTLLDLIPATRLQIDAGKMTWPKSGHVMNLTGIDLALRHPVQLQLDGNCPVPIANLATIAFLKMASWLDRPHERSHDLDDLGYILTDYLADDDMRRWDDPRLADSDHANQGAFALGLDIADIAGESHREIVRTFVSKTQGGSYGFDRLARSSGIEEAPDDSALSSRLAALQEGIAYDRRGRQR